MTANKLSAALILLPLLSTVIGITGCSRSESLVAEADPVVMHEQEAPVSCANPGNAEEEAACEQIENQILAVTVRIELHAQYYSQGNGYKFIETSHGTIMSGRYLVTHNHFQGPLAEKTEDSEINYLAVSLRKADGTLILEKAPLRAFEIVHRDDEMLVWEFQNQDGAGLFAEMGLPSADFVDWHEIDLQPGMELAQIDWDGERTHVDWVLIEGLRLEDAVPHLQLNNFAEIGSSGGGVFWNGRHIGNNWTHNIAEDLDTGEVTRLFSKVAMDDASLTE